MSNHLIAIKEKIVAKSTLLSQIVTWKSNNQKINQQNNQTTKKKINASDQPTKKK